MSRQRDSQRSKCYAAERATSMWGVMQWGKRPDIGTCQQFIDGVLARSWAVTLWNRAPVDRRRLGGGVRRSVEVTDSGGRGGASASRHTIYVSTYYRNHIVLLHELAHSLTPTGVGHGREWARTYLLLVTKVMGRAAGAELRKQFVAHRVKYRVVTEAQRAAGHRLAKAATPRGDGGAGLARWRAERAAQRVGASVPPEQHAAQLAHLRAVVIERRNRQPLVYGPYLPE